MKRIRGGNHTTRGKTFWKALACGIAIATFTGTVSLAYTGTAYSYSHRPGKNEKRNTILYRRPLFKK